jgi:hypothetical protein
MQTAVRSYFTAGIALVGATAIVASPITMAPADIQVPKIASAAVELSAFQDPIALWADVLGTAANNVAGLGAQFASDPAPLLAQILVNQIHSATIAAGGVQQVVQGLIQALSPENPNGALANLKVALDQIAAGNIQLGLITALQTVTLVGFPVILGVGDAWPAVYQPFKNLANLVENGLFPVVFGVGLGALLPIFSVTAATGQILEDLVSSANNLDPVTFASTIINAPAVLTGALLNGFVVDFSLNPGLLTAPQGGTPGALSGVLTTLSQLADLIKTPGTDRHDPIAALTDLVHALTGGLLGGQAVGARAAVDVAPNDPAALPSAAPQTFTLTAGPDTGTTKRSVVSVSHTSAGSVKENPVTEQLTETTGTTPPPATDPSDTGITPASGTATDSDGATGSDATTGSDGAAAAGSTESGSGPIVRDSPKSTPGKTGTTGSTPRDGVNKVVKSVSDGLNSAVSKIGQGSNGLAKSAKPAKSGTAGASTGGASSSSDGSSSNSSGGE